MTSTICALATPRGQGGIAVLRISGDAALEVLRGAFEPAHIERAYEPWRMMYGRAVGKHGETLDEVLAVYMPGPRSYTREDVAEIHCHGGMVSARVVLERLIQLGAIPARPGEFTKRAYLNGRIDLTRAEAVMALIGAGSEAEARASVRQLEGGVSGFVRGAAQRILNLLSLIEAGLDFPEEIDEFASAKTALDEVNALIGALEAQCSPDSARLLREGASIVLAGRPNVGKSSLMNALIGQERAIVTHIPGTTRDVLTERVSFGGILAELSDTAGQRDTQDVVERIGVDRARNAMERADLLLIVIDASEPLSAEDEALLKSADERCVVCLNKCDLAPTVQCEALPVAENIPVIELSAATGAGVDALRLLLSESLRARVNESGLTVERHISLALRAVDALKDARSGLDGGVPLDLVSIDLKRAYAFLTEILGTHPTETLIDEIFSRFCVGK